MNPSRHSGAIRELLQMGGRTTAQGTLGWRLVRSENTFPIPGFKIEAQALNKLGALQPGALPLPVMQEIDSVLAELG